MSRSQQTALEKAFAKLDPGRELTKAERTALVADELAGRPTAQLFVGGGKGLMLSPAQEAQAAELRDNQRLFLYAFARTGTLAGAQDAMTVDDRPTFTVSDHEMALQRNPTYKALYDALNMAVTAIWERRMEEVALKGLEEHEYDGDGNLKRRRVRQDASLISKVLAAKSHKYQHTRDGGGTVINVVIERSEE